MSKKCFRAVAVAAKYKVKEAAAVFSANPTASAAGATIPVVVLRLVRHCGKPACGPLAILPCNFFFDVDFLYIIFNLRKNTKKTKKALKQSESLKSLAALHNVFYNTFADNPAGFDTPLLLPLLPLLPCGGIGI